MQYAISHQANVVVCKYAYLARSDLYDTIVDSGATCDIINDTKYATHEFNFTPVSPEDGVRLGDNTIKLTALGYCDIGILKKIMIVPNMTINLISGFKLDLLEYAILIMNQQAQLVKGTHASVTSVIEGLQAGTVSGYTVTAKRTNKKWVLQNGVCEQCMLGKSKLPSFYRSQISKSQSPGDYVFTDIMGPFATKTFDGEKYALTYTDWYS